MTTEPPPMSERHAIARSLIMSHTGNNDEQSAKLAGLFAVLALPPVRMSDGTHRRRVVEVEVSANKWVAIIGAAIEHEVFVCWTGNNGSMVRYKFVKGENIPDWRMPREVAPPKYLDGGG
jgi:hypothetical protein